MTWVLVFLAGLLVVACVAVVELYGIWVTLCDVLAMLSAEHRWQQAGTDFANHLADKP